MMEEKVKTKKDPPKASRRSLERPVVDRRPENLVIEFQDVSKRYGDIVALDHFNLKIYRNEFVSLIGPSGAGKSTVVRLLVREELPSQGQILIAGKDITKLKFSDLPYYRRQIGVVFQDFKLLPQKTVDENITFALEVAGVRSDEIQRRVTKVMELVSLSDRGDNYPAELSGGEKQRTAIARALVNGPKLLIADEPTGNLDPENAWDIIRLLLRINQLGTIVMLATHNKDVVDRIRQRVVVLEEGKIVSDEMAGIYTV
jgi:cell division transport system ATP-binding protein